MGRPTAGWGSINCAGEFLRFHQPENPQELSRTHSISYMGRPTAGWGSINCAGAGQPGRVWQARTAPGVAMLPGEAGINVRKTARYASKDCDPLHGPGSLTRQYKDPQHHAGAYWQISYTRRMKSRTEYVRRKWVKEVRRQTVTHKRPSGST